MHYTIKEVSEITELPASTLRYYEKEALLPNIKRMESGVRIYDDYDLEWISLISCLKQTDMPIAEIRKFVALSAKGDQTLGERRDLVLAHKAAVEKRISELQGFMARIDYKVDYYHAACAAGTEDELKWLKYPEHIFAEKEVD